MSEHILAVLTGVITAFIRAGSYGAVTLLMAIESACIPLPSEVIMPFAGFVLGTSMTRVLLVATAGAIGCNLGSIPAYWLGRWGGRPGVARFGRFVLLNMHDLDRVDGYFHRFGALTVMVGRLLPVVRTFIALPAGIARMNQVRFHIYTFVGSWPWCFVLAYVGMKLGDHWNNDPRFQAAFHRFHLGVELAILAAIVWFVWTHWKNRTGAETA